MAQDPATILAGIPEWRGADIEQLCGGYNNATYRLTKGDRSAVLKLDVSPRDETLNPRVVEAQIQNMAAQAGLAPAVIFADERMYLGEYVEGTAWARGCLGKKENLERLARTLKKLHALPLTGRSFDARVAAKRYVEKISGLDASVVRQCQRIIESMRLPQNLCCCHNDLVIENILTTPGLVFIDWEYACDNDPFFDLATVIEHHELSDAQANLLLDTYFDGDGQRWRPYLEKQRKLYLALYCLWLASRPGSDMALVRSVAERVATSCS